MIAAAGCYEAGEVAPLADQSHQAADCRMILEDPRLAHVSEDLRALGRSSIRILAKPLSEEPPLGHSKLGGRPDLPQGVGWPTVKIDMPPPSEGFLRSHPNELRLPPDGIVHLPFIAQINLAEVADYDTEQLLPPSGLLYFFYNPHSYPSDTGDSPKVHDEITGYRYSYFGWDNPGNWRVIYFAGDGPLRRREHPEAIPTDVRYRVHGVRFRNETVLPCAETVYIGMEGRSQGDVVLSSSEWDAYADLRYDLRANINLHQMLGYPDQYAMTTDEYSYSRWRTFHYSQQTPWDKLDDAKKREELKQIRLLLQLNVFDDNAQWYGRNGQLYYLMREVALKQKDFDKVWAAVE